MITFHIEMTLAGLMLSLFLALSLCHLYRWHRQNYLLIWTVAVALVGCRFLMTLGHDLSLISTNLAITVSRLLNVCASMMIVVGAHAFLGRRTPTIWLIFGGAIAALVAISPWLNTDLHLLRIFIYCALGVLLILSGFRIFGSDYPGWGRVVTAGGLLCYGVYAVARVMPFTAELIAPFQAAIELTLVGVCTFGILVMHFDLAEEAERKSRCRLERAARMESLGRMAGGVAHDFNNLLTVIMGSFELIEKRSVDTEVKQDVAEARRACTRAAELTHQLLLFSRNQPARVSRIDFVELCRCACELLQRLLPESIELDVNLPDEAIFVRGVATQLEQLVINLGVNARDAMPTGGSLRIKLSSRNDWLELRVSDTGKGIHPELHDRIFEPFFTTKEVGVGTGLGLSMAYGLVKRMGGQITVGLAPEGGAAFLVELPQDQKPDLLESVAVSSDETPKTINADALSILLVEDDAAARAVMVRFLQSDGHRVVSTHDPRQALQLGTHESFDLVIADFVMPGMSGKTLLDKLRATKRHSRFILISGYTDWNENLPADIELLPKPLSGEKLRTAIQQRPDETFESDNLSAASGR